MLELYANAESIGAITAALSTSEHRPPRGPRWTNKTVVRVLKAEGVHKPDPRYGALLGAAEERQVREGHAAGKTPTEIVDELRAKSMRSLRGEDLAVRQIRGWLYREGLLDTPRARDAASRFRAALKEVNDCLVWQGLVHPDGHGIFDNGRKVVSARRFAWELEHGPLGKGAQLESVCPLDNKLCVSAEHQRLRGTFQEEFYARIGTDPDTGCEPWLGQIDAAGYGRVKRNGKPEQAHRVAWELRHGPLPEGYQLHHRCRNRACTKPAHVLPVADSTEHAAVARLEKTIIAGAESGELWDELEALKAASTELPRLEDIGSLRPQEVATLEVALRQTAASLTTSKEEVAQSDRE
jgi:hypothetical protein